MTKKKCQNLEVTTASLPQIQLAIKLIELHNVVVPVHRAAHHVRHILQIGHILHKGRPPMIELAIFSNLTVLSIEEHASFDERILADLEGALARDEAARTLSKVCLSAGYGQTGRLGRGGGRSGKQRLRPISRRFTTQARGAPRHGESTRPCV